MKRVMIKVLVPAALLGGVSCPSAAYSAGGRSFGELYESCREIQKLDNGTLDDEFNAGYCLGFVSGMGIAMQANCSFVDSPGLSIKPSNDKQRIQVILNWGEDHPEDWDKHESYAVRVLALALPCEK